MLRTEKLPVFQVQVPHPLPSEFLDCSSKAPSPSRHPGPGATSKNHFSPETCLTTDQGSRTKCIPRLTLGPPEHLPCTHLPRSPEKKKKNPQAPFSAVKPEIHSPMHLPGSMVSLYWASAEPGAAGMGSGAAGTLSRSRHCRRFPVAR